MQTHLAPNPSEDSAFGIDGEAGLNPKQAQDVLTIPSTQDLPPDGGVKAWLVVTGGFCSLFVSFGWINCSYLQLSIKFYQWLGRLILSQLGIGVFQDYYQSHQLSGFSSSTIAWIPSLQTFVMFLGVRLLH